MWKKYKFLIISAIIITIAFSAIVIVFSAVTASPKYEQFHNPYEYMEKDFGYAIVKADYDIVVGKDRVADVTEKITVAFYDTSHGIVRYLPTDKGEQYSSVTVDGDDYFVTSEGGFICVNTGKRIGGPTYSGGKEKDYVIRYKIVPPTNTARSTNYYMNVVPYGWTTSQKNVTLKVTMPYDIKDFMVFAGNYGSTTQYSGSGLNVNANVLTFAVGDLSAFQGVTVDIETGKRFSLPFSVGGLLAIIFALAAVAAPILFKNLAAQDRPVVEVVNSEPPMDYDHRLDPAEAGYLVDGKCEMKDITAMIFYFASKGYLEIENVDDNPVLIAKGIPDDLPEHQKTIYYGLFKSGDRVTSKQLKDKFYSSADRANTQIISKYKKRLYESDTDRKSRWIGVVSFVVLALLTIVLGIRISPTILSVSFLYRYVLMIVGMFAMFMLGRSFYAYKEKFTFRFYRNVVLLVLIASLAAGFIFSLAFSYFGGFMPFYGAVACYAAAFVSAFLSGSVRKRTEYYANMLGQIKGFKNFLTAVDKDRMLALIEENPEYYYDVLPYINVLGIDDKWADKFSNIDIPPATYYVNAPDVFDLIIFNNLVRSTFTSYSRAMGSRPQQRNYGGGKGIFGGKGGFGGGFGGGGFGGGGGGRR